MIKEDAEADLLARLGYRFTDSTLLTLALTHRSYCAENPGVDSNERLEFLGDAVVGLAVTDHIYDAYGELAEGELAKLRASVVNTSSLAAKGVELGLGPLLRLGKGEDHSGGRSKESILADSFEAVIGAVFVDSDWEQARTCVLDLLAEDIVRGAQRPGGTDFKTRLQELVAKRELGSPVYRISSTGPDHDRRFTALVLIGGAVSGQGRGTSKKRAEQEAAEAAWVSLVNQKEARDD